MDETGLVKDDLLLSMLETNNPRLQCAAIYALLSCSQAAGTEKYQRIVQQMLYSDDDKVLMAVLQLLARLPMTQHLDRIISLRGHTNSRIVHQLLDTLQAWQQVDKQQLLPLIESLLNHEDPMVRLRCMRVATRLPKDTANYLAESLLEDTSDDVRTAAISVRFDTADLSDACDRIIENHLSPRAQHSLLRFILKRRPPAALIRKMAYTKAEDAHAVSIARHALDRFQNSGEIPERARLMQFVLQEREQQILALVLMLLEYIENPNTIAIIREGLLSGDQRYIASASEAVRHIGNKRLARLMDTLLDDISQQQWHDAGKRFPSLHSVLVWCRERRDPWLFQVAQHVMAKA
jgi:hypothetical protein